MGKITVKINDALEQQFRVQIAKQGGRKGDLAKSIEEAMRLWLKTKDPIDK